MIRIVCLVHFTRFVCQFSLTILLFKKIFESLVFCSSNWSGSGNCLDALIRWLFIKNLFFSVVPAEQNPPTKHQYVGSIKYRRARLNLNLMPLANIATNGEPVENTSVCLTIPINNNRKSLELDVYLNKQCNEDVIPIDTTLPLDKQR